MRGGCCGHHRAPTRRMTDRIVPPKPHVAARARVSSFEQYQRLYAESLADPGAFWARQAQRLSFLQPFTRAVHQEFADGEFSWFLDGKLNASFNCVDRHLADKRAETAILWAAAEPGTYRHVPSRELHENVCRLANVLWHHGVRRGARVCLYLPMIPELAYAMLACARIGAIHSVVFAGLSAGGLRNRAVGADCRLVLTETGGRRHAQES